MYLLGPFFSLAFSLPLFLSFVLYFSHSLLRCNEHTHTHTGFDEYYKSLRPRLAPEDCTQAFVNRPHPHDPKLQINCRNIWFNEFWSQHHKCSLVSTTGGDDQLPRCTGNETLTNYEQEGLVPFVGKLNFVILSKVKQKSTHNATRNGCRLFEPRFFSFPSTKSSYFNFVIAHFIVSILTF